MALIDEVQKICRELAPQGWQSLLQAHGLDISRDDLATALREPLSINRDLAGFRDFAAEGTQGITPGVPAHSLLYHALASPHVVTDDHGAPLRAFPSLRQIETVESYVYAAAQRTLLDVLNLVRGMPNFAIAMFAVEYRSKQGTPHRAHADMCFSRTGVARVGNEKALYVPDARGYVSFGNDDSPQTIRVHPARYAPYIAVQQRGDEASFGPARFDLGLRTGQSTVSDANTDFWVPLHKLFDGEECLTDRNLTVDFDLQHTNEKLRRIHMENMGRDRTAFDSGHSSPEIDRGPFRVHDGIAELSSQPDDGICTVVPTVHTTFVEEVRDAGNKRTATNVPPSNGQNPFNPTFLIQAAGRARRAPEYVHVRDRILSNGNLRHLNDERRGAAVVDGGNYQAQHYHDFTGDGWIRAECAQIASRIPRSVPAFSLVSAPDFFPLVGQGELMDWWLSSAAAAFRSSIWWQANPFSLSDQRTAPNLSLNETASSMFRTSDISVSALISQPLFANQSNRQPTRSEPADETRHSSLPDYASGVFAPGWDVSLSRDDSGNEHLAGYGLGSPFPEDAKLCAALSTFWPAAAPDSSRQYIPGRPLVCPLTDDEVGLNALPSWDGNPGPKVVTRNNNVRVVEYTRDAHVDYVANFLAGDVSVAASSKVTFEEYISRLLAIHRAYQAIGVVPPNATGTPEEQRRWNQDRGKWGLISFTQVDQTDPDVQAAARDGHTLSGIIFKFHLYVPNGRLNHPDSAQFNKVHVRIGREEHVLVDPRPRALVKDTSGTWIRESVT